MGQLTTITLYNDSLHTIKENPKEFTQSVVTAMGSCTPKQYSIKGDTVFKGQRYMHSSDDIVFLQTGNTTYNMSSPWQLGELYRKNPEYLNKLVDILETNLNTIKSLLKEV